MSNDALLENLNKWAREHAHIYPDVSTCRFYHECNAHGILNGKHCMMIYVGREYGAPGVVPRLVVVGMDHGEPVAGSFTDRQSGIEHWYQNGHGAQDGFDRHYAGVVKTAAAVLGYTECNSCVENGMCQKSRAPSRRCVIDCIAQPNVVKCVSDLARDRNCKATSTMWGNCAHHLVEELKILRPGLVVFHGVDAGWSVRNAIKPDVLHAIEPERIINRKGEPMLYEWPVLGAHLLFLYHPSSRGRVADQEWDKTAVPALDYLRRNGHIPA
jgi:hypothetical protein